MYALKKITTIDGRKVEEVRVLGGMYRLEFHPEDALVAASVEYSDGANMPHVQIARTDEAYITTLEGTTVRFICRGRPKRNLPV